MTITNLLVQRCASCDAPGPVLCRVCRFSLASTAATSVHGVPAAMPFDGVARRVLLALKYRNRRAAARSLAVLVVARLRLRAGAARGVDVVTWAPTGPERVRARGYDQAELLAREVARELGVPCRRLLHRAHGEPQTGRDRIARLVGPRYRARPGRGDQRVLVVDDVVTTGATLRAAAAALAAAGWAQVLVAAVAATPDAPATHPAVAPLALAG